MMRHVFLATVIAVLAAVTTGTAAAVLVTPQTTSVASISPSNGAVVGIAHPVTVRFTAPVTDRARAERSVHVGDRAGTFSWADDKELVWNSTGYLPADARFTVTAGNVRSEFRPTADQCRCRHVGAYVHRVHSRAGATGHARLDG